MSDERDPRPETRAAQALGWEEPTMRSVVPPVWTSASYERDAAGGYPGGHSYTRDQSPAYDQPEALLASLEGGERALLFSSGMSAAAAVLDALEPGAHVVAPASMYWTFSLWLEDRAAKGAITLDRYATGDLDSLARVLKKDQTQLLWLESPANPLLEITDLAAAAELGHAAGAVVAADSTLATPVHTRPLELGVDLVMHSATKQLNGHADVVAGALVAREAGPLWERIERERGYRGAVLGPFEAWLLLRGMRTLFLRVRQSSAGALRVAESLQGRAGVTEVLYPGLPTHPRHELASRQMHGGFGCLVSFRVEGGEARAREVAAHLRLFRDATSLGGVESLVEHRASVEGSESDLPRDLLRLSIGIEDPADLVEDLRRAIED